MAELDSESVKFSKKDIAVRITCVLLILLLFCFVFYIISTWNRVNSAKVGIDELSDSVFVSTEIRLVIGVDTKSIDIYADNQRYSYDIKSYEDNVMTYIDDKGKERYILILDKDTVYIEVLNEVCEREK